MQTEALFWAGKAKFDSRIGAVLGGEGGGKSGRKWSGRGNAIAGADDDERGRNDEDGRGGGCRSKGGRRRRSCLPRGWGGMGKSILFKVFGFVYDERQRTDQDRHTPRCADGVIRSKLRMNFEPTLSSLSTTSYTPSHGPSCPGEGCLVRFFTAHTFSSPFHCTYRIVCRCDDRKRQSLASEPRNSDN